MKPNKQNIKTWVEALRSGRFSQTRGHLRDQDGYCCLGVACELYREATGIGEWLGREARGTVLAFTSSGAMDSTASTTRLPRKVASWLGLGQLSPEVETDMGYLFLANLNDGFDHNGEHVQPYNFGQIADLIEKEYLGEETPYADAEQG